MTLSFVGCFMLASEVCVECTCPFRQDSKRAEEGMTSFSQKMGFNCCWTGLRKIYLPFDKKMIYADAWKLFAWDGVHLSWCLLAWI